LPLGPCLGVEGPLEQTSILAGELAPLLNETRDRLLLVAPMMLRRLWGRHGQSGGLEARERLQVVAMISVYGVAADAGFPSERGDSQVVGWTFEHPFERALEFGRGRLSATLSRR
jgi:hypothetical protein